MSYLPIILAVIGILIYFIDRGSELISKKQKKIKWITFILVLILLIASNILQYSDSLQKEKYSRDSGILSGKLDNNSIIYPKISYTEGGGSIIMEGGTKGEKLFGVIPLEVWIENGQLKISTIVRDEKGKIIAKIDNNEWQVTKGSVLDRNFDNKAIEVINNKDEVILQVKFNGESVSVSGIFYNESGSGWFMGPVNKTGFVVGTISAVSSSFGNETKLPEIERLFKYPSELHPGERI